MLSFSHQKIITQVVAGCASAVLMVATCAALSVLCFMVLWGSVSLFMPTAMKAQNSRIEDADRAALLSICACVIDMGAVFSNLTLEKTADISVPGVMGVGALFCARGFYIYNYYSTTE